MILACDRCAESGIVVENETTLVAPDGTEYARLYVRDVVLSGPADAHCAVTGFVFQHRRESDRREVFKEDRGTSERKTDS